VTKEYKDLEHDKINIITDGDTMEVLPLKNMVLYPGVMISVSVTRQSSQRLVQTAQMNQQLVAVLCQKDRNVQEPKENDLYPIGSAGRIRRLLKMPDGSTIVVLEGVDRIQATQLMCSEEGKIYAKVQIYSEQVPKTSNKEFTALISSIRKTAIKAIESCEGQPQESVAFIRTLDIPEEVINYVIVNYAFSIETKQQLLEVTDVNERGTRLLELLNKELQMLKMQQEMRQKAQKDIEKDQREYFLHHQLQAIQRELGDTGEKTLNDMRERAKSKHWSEAVKKRFEDELLKLQRTPTHAPDYSIQQNLLETILDLPWNEYSEDNYDLAHAQQVLDRDHFGMEKVKERIIEYLAVQGQLVHIKKNKANPHSVKSPILCLYGPPGVGKTSLGKSIAQALGRKYARISLGGLHDEAEIRGHRKTYIGAMPGRIIENIRKVQTSNPVFVLDEIDKIGADYKGDPTSALLEVLDPEQNNTFHDNYLDIDYDLSQVLFIATANSLDTIPRPLLDRMELIEMTGYLMEEKIEIAKHHLLPKQLENHGLKPSQLKLKNNVLEFVIDRYTRESGVRNLDRQLATLCRKVVTANAKNEEHPASLNQEQIIHYLGQPRYTREAWETNKYIGVVTGLAWTQVGGEILFIETSLSTSKQPTLTLTGNLGDVMKESATLALGYIKAHAREFGIAPKDLDTTAVHIHVPEGAIPKDGPSAGITMTTALVSAFTHRKVRARIAMTGEMTLRGKVLPIGGVKEKILAAKRAGITDLVLCLENRKDVESIPAMYCKGLTFHYVQDIREVIDFALLK